MAIIRWRDTISNPLADLVTLGDRVNRLFEDNFLDWNGGLPLSRLAPAVDIVEKEGEIVISAELPGIDQKDIDVEIHDGILTISGEKKGEAKTEDGDYCRCERTYGRFERSFSLPVRVNAEAVKASYKRGVLEVHLPIAEEAKAKKVDIAVTGE
jgi:HSP20 family protein